VRPPPDKHVKMNIPVHQYSLDSLRFKTHLTWIACVDKATEPEGVRIAAEQAWSCSRTEPLGALTNVLVWLKENDVDLRHEQTRHGYERTHADTHAQRCCLQLIATIRHRIKMIEICTL